MIILWVARPLDILYALYALLVYGRLHKFQTTDYKFLHIFIDVIACLCNMQCIMDELEYIEFGVFAFVLYC